MDITPNEQSINTIRLLMIDVLTNMKDEVLEKEQDVLLAETLFSTVTKLLSIELDNMLDVQEPIRIINIVNEDLKFLVDLDNRSSTFIVYDDEEPVYEIYNFLQ